MKPTGEYPGLYLDWESTVAEHGERVGMIVNGAELPYLSAPLLYRRCYGKLADQVSQIKKIIGEKGIRFIVIDSAGLACGGKPSDEEMTILLYQAVRQLGEVTSLIIGHIPKDHKDEKPGGSNYWWHYARSAWEMRRVNSNHGMTHTALYHRKANGVKLQPPIGYELLFDEVGHAVRFQREDVTATPQPQEGLTDSQKVWGALRDGEQLNREEILEQTSVSKESLSQIFSRDAKRPP